MSIEELLFFLGLPGLLVFLIFLENYKLPERQGKGKIINGRVLGQPFAPRFLIFIEVDGKFHSIDIRNREIYDLLIKKKGEEVEINFTITRLLKDLRISWASGIGYAITF